MKFYVTFLTKKLAENREHHIKEFNEAVAGYWNTLENKALVFLEDVKTKNPNPKFTAFNLAQQKPESHEEDYDRVLSMLSNTTEQQVELDQENYAKYVLDDWKWTGAFKSINSTYTSRG